MSFVLLSSDEADRVVAWIGYPRPPELQGPCTVSTIVPSGFAAYVRILHRFQRDPVYDERTYTWAEMAARAGVPYGPEITSGRIRGTPEPDVSDSRWLWAPDEGDIDSVSRGALAELLSARSASDAFFAFGIPASLQGLPVPLVFRSRVAEIEQVRSAAGQLGEHGTTDGPMTGPELWWPEDHAWLVVTDLDADSTIVAAGSDIADAILADPTLEALAVSPDTRLDPWADAPPGP